MGGGKSVWGVNEGIQLSLDYPGNRGYICRHESVTFKKTTYLKLLEWLPEELIRQHHKQDQYIILKNGSRIDYGGLRGSQADKPLEKLKSMELGWFFVDEASETELQYFNLMCSRLRPRDGWPPPDMDVIYKGLLASNPEQGWLKSTFIDKTAPDQVFIQALPTDNPYLPPNYIPDLRRRYPPEWVKRYLEGDWEITGSDNYVFPFSLVMAACQRVAMHRRGEQIECGLDVARYGKDLTVLASRQGNEVRIELTMSKKSTMETVGEVALILDKLLPDIARIDTVGIGAGVYDRLLELGYPVEEFSAGTSPDDKNRFFNRKAEVYWALRDRLEEGEISLPDDDDLRAQLCSIRYRIQSDKKIRIESKDEMRDRGLPSPDAAEAVITAFGSAYGGLEVYSDESSEEDSNEDEGEEEEEDLFADDGRWSALVG